MSEPLTEAKLEAVLREIWEMIEPAESVCDGMLYFTDDPRPAIDTGKTMLLRDNDGTQKSVRIVGRIAESIHEGYWCTQYKVIVE